MTARVTRGVATAALLASLVLTGCNDIPREHADGEGPLSATSGGVTYAMSKPADSGDSWIASFGSFLLCNTNSSKSIELKAVTWESTDPQPLDVEPVLRVNTGNQDAFPHYGVIGKVWDSDDITTAGTSFVHDVSDYRIDQSCEDLRGGPKSDFTELFLVMEAGPEGADMTEFSISYTANGRPYRLQVTHRNMMCGTTILERPEDDPGHMNC